MKAFHIIWLLVFFLLNVKGFDCFSQRAVFTEVPPPSSVMGVACGTQDPSGYMWFGSIGLHRYDGYSYKSYYNDPLDSTSLAYNRIQSILADGKGFIWVGTNGGGLDRLDPESGIFTHYRHDNTDSKSISNNLVSAILEDRNGKIWVGTETGGLNCLDPTTGIFTRFPHDPGDSTSLSHSEVRVLYEDRQGTIWVGTGFPWVQDSISKKGGLNRFNPSSKNFTRFLHDPNDPSSLIDNRIGCIYEDSKGRFWVGTSGDGLHTMDRENGTFERHQYNAAEPNGLSRPPVRNVSWHHDIIWFINEDAAGNMWIGTGSGGLNHYDPKALKMSYYSTPEENPKDKNQVSGVGLGLISKDGVLWVTTIGGLFRTDPLHKQIPFYDVGTMVCSILQDHTGKLWVGTNQGLIVYDSTRISKTFFAHDFSHTTRLRYNGVFSIFEDSKGTIWIGTGNCLDRFDYQSKKFTHYLNEAVHTIYEDQGDSLGLVTPDGRFILMSKANGTSTNYHPKASLTRVRENSVTGIKEDKAGLWIGTAADGLQRFDKKNKIFQHYLLGYSILAIYQSTDSVLWVGTDRGLYYLNQQDNRFVPFTNPGAGLIGNISVSQILEDDRRSLWINTGVGLFRLRHERTEISFFGEKEGLISKPALQNTCIKGIGGELFFGEGWGGRGYYSFFPEQLEGNTTAPDLQITGFSISDQLVSSGTGTPLSLPISKTKDIFLAHDQNAFSFDFVGMHYSNPEDNSHLFKLEKFDGDWHKAGEEKSASYYNVPPGKYVFRVKAASSNGIWAEKAINIIIAPPWWQTWWAYSIYGLLGVALVVGVHRIQKARVIEEERQRTRERELAQAKEIEKAYHELKTTQAQLVQREKMASLGELTAGIAHEIQNPLNFVNNFSDVNKELLDEMKEEMDKGNLNEAKAIATDVIANEEKINHHGKRADGIVKGMLQHSRSSSGVKELTDINALADEYLRLAYHGLRAKDKSFNATMKTDFDASIGNINIIPQDIGRVILNVITNAFYAVSAKTPLRIGASADGSYDPTVSVSTRKIGDKVEIRVVDNGNGIPPNILDKIFQPFFTTKPTGQGTGLGLSLAYDIVKAHGGELSVKTKEGEGAEFTIQLPYN
jgi:signal transduction histidine kinase/ligand-binding sensor domain-containing protein